MFTVVTLKTAKESPTVGRNCSNQEERHQTNVYKALAAFNKGWITQTYNSIQ